MLALIVVLLIATFGAQTLPPRDTRPTPGPARSADTPTGVIRGRVVASDTGRPLSRATITATTGFQRRSISTDREGRYELIDLPAGRYEVSVERVGYLTLRYGQRFPRERAGTLALEAGTAVENLDFALPRASVINGRIVDELGDPIAQTIVMALAWQYGPEGRRNLVPLSRATTDADGEYRLVNLPPGTYVVVAQSSASWPGSSSQTGGTLAYVPTYFPGALTAASAEPIAMRVGERRTTVDIALVPGRLATISGVAVNSRGEPLTSMSLLSTDGYADSAGRARIMGDGTFEIPGVRPGRYVLLAGGANELIRQPVEVAGSDVTGLTIRSVSGWSMTGEVLVDPSSRSTLDMTRVSISTLADDEGGSFNVIAGAAPGVARPAPNGRFILTPAFGRVRLRLNLPPGWILKSATAGGRTVSGVPLELPPGATLSDARFIVTDVAASVEGRLVDASGAPTAVGTVMAFRADAATWSEATGTVRWARPDQRGEFRIEGLPGGSYHLVAVDYVEIGTWNDSNYLRSLLPYAIAVTAVEGKAIQAVTLRVLQ